MAKRNSINSVQEFKVICDKYLLIGELIRESYLNKKPIKKDIILHTEDLIYLLENWKREEHGEETL